MGTRAAKGFTIIEVTLFLAVSGLLILMMVAGAGSAIASQRYNDSVQSFKNLVQKQYASLSSVQNARSASLECNGAAKPITGGTPEATGQSDCYIIGKYMSINGSGDISIYTVLARDFAYVGSAPTSTIDSLKKKYTLGVSTADVERTELQWGTRLKWPAPAGADASTSPAGLSLLFVRSPDDGQIYTFTNAKVPATEAALSQTFLKSDMLTSGSGLPGQGKRTVCVDSTGWSSGNVAIVIAANAAGANAVSVQSNGDAESLGVPERC
jgi:type II secretory pathway pseudopilin PulG